MKANVNERAYLLQRLYAFVIDYFLSSIAISLIPMLITSIITQEKAFNTQTFATIPLMWQIISSVLAILISIGYFVVYPMSKGHLGQTPGKRFSKIKVVCQNGEELKLGNMMRRELLGSLILEGEAGFSAAYMNHLLYIIFPNRIIGAFVLMSMLVSVLSVIVAVFGRSHRMLHDYVGGTIVVNVEK